MAWFALTRVRHNGETVEPGDRIDCTDKEGERLAKLGAAQEGEPKAEDLPGVDPREENGELTVASIGRLTELVAALDDDAWRQDGKARAETIRSLSNTLGFDVTAEEIAAVEEAS